MQVVESGSSKFNSFWYELLQDCGFMSSLYSLSIKEFYKENVLNNGYSAKDCSFIIIQNDSPIFGFCGSIVYDGNDRSLLSYEVPSISIEKGEKITKNIEALIIKKFSGILKNSNQKVYFHDFLFDNSLSIIGKYLLKNNASSKVIYTQVIDLSLDIVQLKKETRKSYKSLINWGGKNLDIEIFDSCTIALEHMESYRVLHRNVSGSSTRSKSSWLKQLQMVKNKEAFLVLGRFKNNLVSAGFFHITHKNCYYASSASVRELFDKPIFHSLIWAAINYAKEKGCLHFEMGKQIFQESKGFCTNKDFGIAKFKSGFGGQLKVFLEIKKEGS